MRSAGPLLDSQVIYGTFTHFGEWRSSRWCWCRCDASGHTPTRIFQQRRPRQVNGTESSWIMTLVMGGQRAVNHRLCEQSKEEYSPEQSAVIGPDHWATVKGSFAQFWFCWSLALYNLQTLSLCFKMNSVINLQKKTLQRIQFARLVIESFFPIPCCVFVW